VEIFGKKCGGAKNVKHFPINFLAISGNSEHFSGFSGRKSKN
jgi:hypothetical protein